MNRFDTLHIPLIFLSLVGTLLARRGLRVLIRHIIEVLMVSERFYTLHTSLIFLSLVGTLLARRGLRVLLHNIIEVLMVSE